MHNFGRNLAHALLGSLAALPLGCIAGGLAFGAWNYVLAGGMAGFWSNIGLGVSVGLAAILVGILPAFLYGAPVYALVATRTRPGLLAALVIGALPGLTFLLFSSDWGTPFLLFGVPVAVCLHLLAGRRMSSHGSGNPFEPNPLRDAARPGRRGASRDTGLPTSVKDLCERLVEVGHPHHEDIIGLLQQHKDPYAIAYLRQAVLLKPRLSYLAYDDYGSYYRKCFWALRAIGTPDAMAVIEEFADCPDPVVRAQAAYRLSRIRGDAPDDSSTPDPLRGSA